MERLNGNYKKTLLLFKRLFLLMALVPLVVGIFLFIFLNRNYSPGPFIDKVPCVSFSPNGFERDKKYTEAELEAILIKIHKISNCVRIYSVTRGLEKMPAIADRMGMQMIVGAWLNKTDKSINDQEIINLIDIGRKQKNIKYLLVGNETLLLNVLTEDELLSYIDKVRLGLYGTTSQKAIAKIKVKYPPITTTELSHIWDRYPNLIQKVDVLGLHTFPYWEKQSIDDSIQFLEDNIKRTETLTKKPVILMETGWPTNGPRFEKAISGINNQRKYLDLLAENFGREGKFYNIADVFDVPSKITTTEGLLGPHWGILDVNGNDKVLYSIKDISVWAITYILLISIILWYINGFFKYPFIENDPNYERLHDTSLERSLLLAFILISIFACIIAYITLSFSRLVGANLIPLQILYGAITLYSFFEISQKILHFIVSRPATKYLLSNFPKISDLEIEERKKDLVSIHIAAKDESADQVIRTIEHALNQTHKNIEIVYVDNNSKDDSSFLKVKEYFENGPQAQFIGQKLKLFHEDHIVGFKGGALNYALMRANFEAKFIAILDSDYEAFPDWIENGLAYTKTDIGFVQFPQAYRQENKNLISLASRLEQDYVFKVVYPTRAFLGGIVMNGTLVILNREAMPNEGWPLWSICEDGALGAEIIANGFRSAYVPLTMGLGKSTDNFASLRNQRRRWVFGSIQVLKKWIFDKNHRWNNTLTLYLSDWFGWLMHGLYPLILFSTISFLGYSAFLYAGIIFDWTFYLGIAFVSTSLLIFILNFEKYLPINNYSGHFFKFIFGFIKNIFALIMLEISVVNTICRSILISFYRSRMNFIGTRSVEIRPKKTEKEKRDIVMSFMMTLISIAISILFVFVAIAGAFLMYLKLKSFDVLILYGQILIVFLPQIVYVYYRFKY